MELCYDCFCEVWGYHNKEDVVIDDTDSCDECFQKGVVLSVDFNNEFNKENNT